MKNGHKKRNLENSIEGQMRYAKIKVYEIDSRNHVLFENLPRKLQDAIKEINCTVCTKTFEICSQKTQHIWYVICGNGELKWWCSNDWYRKQVAKNKEIE